MNFRPRIFADASFVNKNASSGYTWSPIAEQGGDLVDDLNVSGAGERLAVLHVLADWRDADGSQRKQLTPNSILVARGIAISHTDFLPLFEALNRDARDMLPADVVEIHLENAEITSIPTIGPRVSRKRSKKIYPTGQPPFTNPVWACAGERSQKWSRARRNQRCPD